MSPPCQFSSGLQEAVQAEDAQQGRERDHEHEGGEHLRADESRAPNRDAGTGLDHDPCDLAAGHHAGDHGGLAGSTDHAETADDLADERCRRQREGQEQNRRVQERIHRNLGPDQEEEHRGHDGHQGFHSVLELLGVVTLLLVANLFEDETGHVGTDQRSETEERRTHEREHQTHHHSGGQNQLGPDLEGARQVLGEHPDAEEEPSSDEPETFGGLDQQRTGFDGLAAGDGGCERPEERHDHQSDDVVQDRSHEDHDPFVGGRLAFRCEDGCTDAGRSGGESRRDVHVRQPVAAGGQHGQGDSTTQETHEEHAEHGHEARAQEIVLDALGLGFEACLEHQEHDSELSHEGEKLGALHGLRQVTGQVADDDASDDPAEDGGHADLAEQPVQAEAGRADHEDEQHRTRHVRTRAAGVGEGEVGDEQTCGGDGQGDADRRTAEAGERDERRPESELVGELQGDLLSRTARLKNARPGLETGNARGNEETRNLPHNAFSPPFWRKWQAVGIV